MKNNIKLKEDIYWVGVNDRETPLFEGLWQIPDGIAYNSYLIVDEKITLVDTVKGNYQNDYIDRIRGVIGDRKIDYLIINHMEPDHAGSIGFIRQLYPDITVVGNQKTKDMLGDFSGDCSNFKVMAEGDVLETGKHKFKFFLIPMVHWPETMVAYDMESKTVFSSDAFGAYGTLNGAICDDEFDIYDMQDEYLRYYSNIIGKFSPQVIRALAKIEQLDIETICASHGAVLRKNPQEVIKWYKRWSNHETDKGVVVVYGSMYGNTKKLAEHIARRFAEKGIEKIKLYDVSKTNGSFIERDIWRYKTTVFGSCTYNNNLFPMMNFLVSHMENAAMKNRVMGIFGTYSWSGGAAKRLKEFSNSGTWQLVEPVVEAKSSPTDEDFKKADLLVDELIKVM